MYEQCMGQQIGLKSEKEWDKAVFYLHTFLIYMVKLLWETQGYIKNNIRIKVNGRIINNLRYADDTTLIAETKEDLE